MEQKKILIVDDEKLISWSLATMLSKAGYAVETANSGTEAINRFSSFSPDMALLDIRLPDADGLDLLRQFKLRDEELCVIMITANADVDSAVMALKLGAEDYIGKPFNMEALRHVIDKAFEKRQLREKLDFFREELRKKTEHDKLVGNSASMVNLFKMIKVCADTDAKTVLILGESGTGKELVARAIHNHSARAEAPFAEVNCAAIPETLLESELFGHEKGAYTDASKRRKGIFELAEGGTVFLDEIGDMPFSMQAKVLKVIETKRFRRLGAEEDIQADVRIIAATHQDLPAMVKERRFRGDLFYRLNVMNIPLPPLRERTDDIPSLVQYFIERLNEEYGLRVEGVSPETMAYLTGYGWPGNVRELRNAVERTMMLEQSKILTPAFLNAEIKQQHETAHNKSPHADSDTSGTGTAQHSFARRHITIPSSGISLEELERQLIRMGLEISGGNQTKAAKYLKMSRDTLRYRMKKFGLSESSQKDEWCGMETGEDAAVSQRFFPHLVSGGG